MSVSHQGLFSFLNNSASGQEKTTNLTTITPQYEDALLQNILMQKQSVVNASTQPQWFFVSADTLQEHLAVYTTTYPEITSVHASLLPKQEHTALCISTQQNSRLAIKTKNSTHHCVCWMAMWGCGSIWFNIQSLNYDRPPWFQTGRAKDLFPFVTSRRG